MGTQAATQAWQAGEREEGGGGCLAWRERREERRAMRRDKRERRNCRVRQHTCKTGHGQLPLFATVTLEGWKVKDKEVERQDWGETMTVTESQRN